MLGRDANRGEAPNGGRSSTRGSRLRFASRPDGPRRPPGTARALLWCVLPADRRDDILGDLEETFASRGRREGHRRARRWYWGQTVRLATGFVRERWAGAVARPALAAQPGAGDMWSWLSDARFAGRVAAKSPWMTATCVLSLGAAMAVAIGGFSLLWGAACGRLPFYDGERIVAVRALGLAGAGGSSSSLAVFREWQRSQSSFDVLAAYVSRFRDVADGDGGLTPYPVAAVTATAFDVARVRPMLGRVLDEDDQQAGARPVVVVGHRAWRTLLGADPGSIGATLQVDGVQREIVGVMPEGFRFPVSEDFWVPLNIDLAAIGRVGPRGLRVFGRLAEGVSSEQAAAELNALRTAWALENPDADEDRARITTVVPYVRIISEPGAETPIFIGGFVFIVLVLAVACASVGSLLLVRSSARRGEFAIRTALGAGRGRVVRQLFIEALLLTAGGAVFGVVAAQAILRRVGDSVPLDARPFWIEFGMSPAAAVFAVVSAFAAAVLAGALPALRATGLGVADVLKDGHGTASGLRFGSISGALTVANVTLSVAFLATAGLAAQSLRVAMGVEDELPTGRILVAHVSMADEAAFAAGEISVREEEIEAAEWILKQEQVRRAAAAIPGARVAFLADRLPGDEHFMASIELENDADVLAAGVRVPIAVVSPEIFEAFDVTILAGRNFGPADGVESEPVAVVNAAFARRFFPGRRAIGERFRGQSGDTAPPWIRIVGVAGNLRMLPGAKEAAGYYIPASQHRSNNIMLAIRVVGDPLLLSNAVREAVERVDSRIDVSGFQTHARRGEDNLAAFGMMGLTLSALGGTALLLSLSGLYAVIAFSVTQRTHEIGIRLALGAGNREVLGLILRRGLVQIGAGLTLGSALGWGLLRMMQLVPIGIASSGTPLLLGAGAAMLAAGLTACLFPARKALRIQPLRALRQG